MVLAYGDGKDLVAEQLDGDVSSIHARKAGSDEISVVLA